MVNTSTLKIEMSQQVSLNQKHECHLQLVRDGNIWTLPRPMGTPEMA